jgi:hypothetical protein
MQDRARNRLSGKQWLNHNTAIWLWDTLVHIHRHVRLGIPDVKLPNGNIKCPAIQ